MTRWNKRTLLALPFESPSPAAPAWAHALWMVPVDEEDYALIAIRDKRPAAIVAYCRELDLHNPQRQPVDVRYERVMLTPRTSCIAITADAPRQFLVMRSAVVADVTVI